MNAAAAPSTVPDSVSAAELALLRDVIRDRAGIVIQDHQTSVLRQAVDAACQRFGAAGAAALASRLQALGAGAPEWEFLISRVTIGESYFFRDEGQVSFLRDVWLPSVVDAKRKGGTRTLRIWCAGCASGQEPYTVAMLLQDALPDLQAWDVRILATDINSEGLRTAAAARYTEWSFRATPPGVRDRFFSRAAQLFALDERTRALVDFEYLNLVGDPFPSLTNHTAGQDLILCRNVFIYFDRPTIATVMEKFANCLLVGGHLVVGASDPVPLENPGLVYRHGASTGYFVRADAPQAGPLPAKPRPPRARRPAIKAVEATPPRSSAPVMPPPDRAGLGNVFARIRKSDWAGALSLIEALRDAGQDSADLRRARGKVLANMGRLDEAAMECEALIAGGSTDKHVFYLLGLIETDRGDGAAAGTAFRRAIFLDRTFVEAHYQLGLLETRAGNATAGARHFRNALALAEAAPPGQILHEAGTMTMDRLAEVLRQSSSGGGAG